jgi:hypothetical protein
MRQCRHDHPQRLHRIGRTAVGHTRQHILGIERQSVQIRHHTQYRLAGTCLQPVEPRLQQAGIAAKPVDDETADPCAFGFGQAFERTEQMREHPAAIDIGHQQHRAVDRFRKTHVGDVVRTQIDLCRAAGPFNEDRVVLLLQARVRFEHGLEGQRFIVVIGARVQIHPRLAMHDHLRTAIAGRLEQHRVQIRMRWNARGNRLQCLCTADLASVDRDRAVERHVLRLERRDPPAATRHQPAQTGDQRALACVGGCTLDHQRACRHSRCEIIRNGHRETEARSKMEGMMQATRFAETGAALRGIRLSHCDGCGTPESLQSRHDFT